MTTPAAVINGGSLLFTPASLPGSEQLLTVDATGQMAKKPPTDFDVSGAAAAAQAASQPLDSDLTAIAALTTTPFGRAFLALADAAALRAAGGLVIGTDVEAHDVDLTTIAGLSPTNDDVIQRKSGAWINRTPAQLLSDMGVSGAYQPLDSDLTAIAALTTTAFGRALLAAADGAAVRTAIGAVIGTDIEAHDADLTTIAGLTPTNDDILQRKAGAWTNRTIAQFITDLGLGSVYQPLDSDLTAIAALSTTSFGRSLLALADATALRTAAGLGTIATQDASNINISGGAITGLGTPSNPTDVAIKSYVDSAVTGLFDFKGSTDASANPSYPSASKGDAYAVSVAGKIGGASGKSVDIGDLYVASADNAGGTEASVGTSWFVLEHNLVGALLAANNLSDLASASTARTSLGLGTAAVKDIPSSGDASVAQVVYGTDTRLTNSRAPSGTAAGELAGTYPNPTVLNATVIGKLLTGLSSSTNQAIAATDTVLLAFGYLAARANALWARTISAGTGLTGGGDLSADRTLTVSFGTSSSTVCVGNDSRLSDARVLAIARTAVKTANYSAAVGDLIPCDTTGGGFTVTLPTAPVDKSIICIKHIIQGSTNVVTYACGGSDVFNKAGGAASGTLPLLSQAVVLVYNASTAIWTIIADDITLASLDLRFAALSHTHAESDVTNLVSDLALKAPLASPALTGVPTAPTAALATNTTQLATTAFVIANAAGSSADSFARTAAILGGIF